MKVKVNRRTVDIFDGARVRDAVLRYLVLRKMDVKLIETAECQDAAGHSIGSDAPLKDGQTIKVKNI
ncbi:MAG: hypothetical protein J5737_07765 [Bacteroidales bacterium]|nr:hypothetical protein [Bacteroidales bacterium]